MTRTRTVREMKSRPYEMRTFSANRYIDLGEHGGGSYDITGLGAARSCDLSGANATCPKYAQKMKAFHL